MYLLSQQGNLRMEALELHLTFKRVSAGPTGNTLEEWGWVRKENIQENQDEKEFQRIFFGY